MMTSALSSTSRPAPTGKPIALALGLGLALLAPSTPVSAQAEDSELIYECALVLEFAAKNRMNLSTPASRVMAHYGEVTGNDAQIRQQDAQTIEATWAEYRGQNGRKALDRYKLSVAQDCSDAYDELAQREAAEVEGELNSLGTLSAAALRSFATRTGDFGEVANYLVYYYPYGKNLFQPNEDGDLLGQLVVEAGAAGLRRWSDEAIYAIANKSYWQYNPPATRLVFAEYQRRMRMMRQTESEAQRWAQRAADDRAEQARRADAPYVGSLGTGKPYKPKSGSGVYVCTTYQGTGGGRVCKEE
ncbi:hypothetical protein EH31_16990 [Erythrobacter longus]|uniref:Lysozyme inhibitor LprI N-terminal domain-containing protein n=1 Tax=Erythrobacter longus TaxID=1044 RepID=A0A074M7H6_ERYLO|nr:hypothetical protein [Erythrobacter longus]KEO88650.1 hypothetical protein EH31_16990 [Erythrobacter longus]